MVHGPFGAVTVDRQPKEAVLAELHRLTPLEEQFSITPGQAAVFYDGEVLLGGGLIQA